MLISVTQDHINASRRLLESNFAVRCAVCPVALAIRSATGRDWSIMGKTAWFRTGRLIFLSRRCRQWIVRFDNRKAVKPFTFRFAEGVR